MPRITEMFAFVAEEKPGEEGVMGLRAPNGDWYPLVGADVERAVSLKPLAEEVARQSGRPYRCLHFKLVGELPLTQG